MTLPTRGKCPTALHSWGSQVLPCPCGCRPHGFSDHTLCARGVYGVFLPSDGSHVLGDDSFQRIRHLHPSELAVLTGCPVPQVWPEPLRLSLCGLGQQASPLQAAWISGQVRSMLDRFLGISPVLDFHAVLRRLMVVITDQCQCLFPDPTECPSAPGSSEETDTPCELREVQGEDGVSPPVLPYWVSPRHVGGMMAFTLQFEETQVTPIWGRFPF